MFMPTGTFIVDFSIKINSLEMKTLVCHNLIPRQLIDEFCLKQNCRDFFPQIDNFTTSWDRFTKGYW